jgi:outer membrane protein OmpA-like peptidoglycan-associated protein
VVDKVGCRATPTVTKFNGLDACPKTIAGAEVDARGCPKDADSDGVYDGVDKCPSSPTGTRVDPTGCPTDSDNDSVADGPDQCPSTPAGAIVDANGCPVDSDRDGVPDGIDKCLNTPAGTEVDTAGCQRASDSDSDGIDDTKDKCPGTSSGTRVDAAGCPILFIEARQPVVLKGVTFETGRSALRTDSYTILDMVATSLINNPDINVEISGHTDNTGSAATNLRLSQARADAVRAYLATKGVAPERMVAKGYGPQQAVAPNTTPAGRALNRRVELRRTN